MADVPLACNSCWNKLQNKAFKTSCDHCYCEQCADSVFADRRRRCSVCQVDVTALLEFQIVGTPILDEQLTDVRSTLQAIACANGASSLDSWLSGLHRFERIQLALWGSRQGQSAQEALREAEEREKALSERDLQTRQVMAHMEHECEQVKKERDQAQRGVQDLQTALEERSRQADNWRAMYEALKNGGRVPIPPTTSGTSSLPSSSSNRIPQLLPNSSGPNKMLRTSEPTPGYSSGFLSGPDNGAGRVRSGSMFSNDSAASDLGGLRSGLGGGNFPMRSNSLPVRPPTRDSLASLLNRSIIPKTSAPGGGFRGGVGSLGPPPALQQLHDPVRSTFFAPASLRAMSPATNSTSSMTGHHHRSGTTNLAQGGMLY